MKNGQIWQDMDGKDIQAHGGCILQYRDRFYWYGENKGAPNCPGRNRVDVIGISCYSSGNLVDWKYEGIVLKAEPDPESPLHFSKVVERPKVLYNEKTNRFVMWMHLDSPDYSFSGVGIAAAEQPTGPFRLIRTTHPNRQESRDMTLYRDEDGAAYLIHAKDWNKTMNIARLNESYTDLDGTYVSVMTDQEREAPALCKHGGLYYMVTSGCTGWAPNSALYAVSPHIMGHWKLIDNPCEGPDSRKTFFGQSSFLFAVNQKHYLMLDHWIPENLQKSGYSILPVTFDEEGIMTVRWKDTWDGPEK